MEAVERTHQDVTTLYNIKPGNGSSRKDTSGCHHTLHHQFTLHPPELPADCTSHLLHSGKSQRFTMQQVAMYAMDYIDAAATGILSLHVLLVEDLQKMLTHWRNVTFNHVLTSFIKGHTALLQIPMHPHFDCR